MFSVSFFLKRREEKTFTSTVTKIFLLVFLLDSCFHKVNFTIDIIDFSAETHLPMGKTKLGLLVVLLNSRFHKIIFTSSRSTFKFKTHLPMGKTKLSVLVFF